MAHSGAVNNERGRLCRPLFLLLAVLLAGCETPSAHFAGGDEEHVELPRPAILADQIATDSILELAAHPLRTGAAVASETAECVGAIGQGIVAKRILIPLRGAPGLVDPSRPTLGPAALEADLKQVTGSELQPACLTFLEHGPDALAALLRLIDSSACSIDVLMFLWGNDATGRSIAEHLAARAAAGVPVRVLVDGGGNLIYSEPQTAPAREVNGAVTWLARQLNVQVIRTRDGLARFDHRKLVLVDDRCAWTGGRNFRDEGFAQRDLSFLLSGPLIGELSSDFERFWQEQGGRPADRRPVPPPDHKRPCEDESLARLVATGPLRHDLADVVFTAIDHAQHHVYLENPYLCDSRLLLRLVQARRRGADVRVVLTLDAAEDVANRANRVTANYLLQAGVRVYLYPRTTHLKALAVDGCWAYLGTGNFDPLSLRHDYELGIALGAGPAVREIEEALLMPELRPEWELKGPLPVTMYDWLNEAIACIFG